MSKFIDRLKQISLPQPKVMGFRQNNETTARLKTNTFVTNNE
jgi:hypothetical protein